MEAPPIDIAHTEYGPGPSGKTVCLLTLRNGVKVFSLGNTPKQALEAALEAAGK